ncbi:MAG: lysophospholipase [Bermanella sp.]
MKAETITSKVGLRSLTIFWLLFVGLGIVACAPTVMLPGEQVAMPKLNEDTFTTSDNSSLPVKSWLPKGGATNHIIIALHGFNDYSNFFQDSALWLQQYGVASFSYDQRGFGASANTGLWAGSDTMARDLSEFVNVIKKRYPNIPLYLLGESMGGAVVMVTMTEKNAPDVSGIILAAPAVWGDTTMPWYQRWALTIGSYTVPWMKVSGGGLKIKPSDNIPMLRKLGRDPLIIKETRIDAIHGLTNLMGMALERSNQLHHPALILYGELDEIIPKLPTAMMLQNLPLTAKNKQKVALYENGYHMLLRDLNARLPQQDILSWINNPKTPLPSKADIRPIQALLEK